MSNLEQIYSLEALAKQYEKTVIAKIRKGYNEIKMSLGASTKPVAIAVNKDSVVAPSRLDTNVQDFVQLIFNKKLMEESVVKIGFDVKKMPLG